MHLLNVVMRCDEHLGYRGYAPKQFCWGTVDHYGYFQTSLEVLVMFPTRQYGYMCQYSPR